MFRQLCVTSSSSHVLESAGSLMGRRDCVRTVLTVAMSWPPLPLGDYIPALNSPRPIFEFDFHGLGLSIDYVAVVRMVTRAIKLYHITAVLLLATTLFRNPITFYIVNHHAFENRKKTKPLKQLRVKFNAGLIYVSVKLFVVYL